MLFHKKWAKALTQLFFPLTAAASVLCLLAVAVMATTGFYTSSFLPDHLDNSAYELFGTNWALTGYYNRVLLPILGLCALALAVTLFVFAMRGAGRKIGREEITLPFPAKIPLDLLLALTSLLGALVLLLPAWICYFFTVETIVVLAGLCLLVCFYLFLGYFICLAGNIKRGRWWQNTLFYLIGRLLVRGCQRYARLCRAKLNRIPLGFYLFFLGLPTLFFWVTMGEIWDLAARLLFFLLGLFCASALLIGLVTRFKTPGWWRHTLVHWAWRGLRVIPLIWQVGLVFLGLCIIDLVLIGLTNGGQVGAALLLFLFLRLGLLALAAWVTLSIRRLQKGASQLAEGDMRTQVSTHRMFGVFRSSAGDLNRIRGGMQAEIEERMRSERFKTELITNVSHDIKTPLTSIVNYVDLMSKLELDDPKAKEYLKVLERQSARLKKLTEDLIEASKASTGNVPITLADTNLNAVLQQSVSEYEERLAAAELTTVTQVPEAHLCAAADAALLARVFDNLFSNIAHYALPGTRVYIGLQGTEGGAEISFRNISREALPEGVDLLERFSRGDLARNTSGSGLGLSIAKNLMELMDGSLTLCVDGDLFKVTLALRNRQPMIE